VVYNRNRYSASDLTPALVTQIVHDYMFRGPLQQIVGYPGCGESCPVVQAVKYAVKGLTNVVAYEYLIFSTPGSEEAVKIKLEPRLFRFVMLIDRLRGKTVTREQARDIWTRKTITIEPKDLTPELIETATASYLQHGNAWDVVGTAVAAGICPVANVVKWAIGQPNASVSVFDNATIHSPYGGGDPRGRYRVPLSPRTFAFVLLVDRASRWENVTPDIRRDDAKTLWQHAARLVPLTEAVYEDRRSVDAELALHARIKVICTELFGTPPSNMGESA
jgi:hypothetical protein